MLNKIFKRLYTGLLFALPIFVLAAESKPVTLFGKQICADSPCKIGDILPAISTIISFLAIDVAMPIAVLAIAFAGLKMVMYAGNSGEVGKAKDIIFNALWGIGIALAAYLVVNAIIYGLTGGQGANEVINERISG